MNIYMNIILKQSSVCIIEPTFKKKGCVNGNVIFSVQNPQFN